MDHQYFHQSMDQSGMVADPVRGQLNQDFFPPCHHSRLRIWSRETGSAVPSRVSPLMFHTQTESGADARAPLLPPVFRNIDYDVDLDYIITRHRGVPSLRVMILRTDRVHCRESAGTGPVAIKVGPVTGAVFYILRYPHGPSKAGVPCVGYLIKSTSTSYLQHEVPLLSPTLYC